MDEAERCDRIVYILNGKIIARGTVAEVIAQFRSLHLCGRRRRRAPSGAALQGKPGVEHAAFFGAALHVSGRDRAALNSAGALSRPAGLAIHEAPPSLEDVFIHLQEQAQ